MSDDITPVTMSKSEAWELTDEIRQGFETIHENRMNQVDRLARAYEGSAWVAMGYDSFDEYKVEEFGEDLQHQRFELEERVNAVKVLSDSGMAKVQIADILGVHRNTVTNLLKRIDAQPAEDAQGCASTEVDAAGQSVEEAGLIEDDESQLQFNDEPSPTVTEEPQVSEEDDEESDEERKARLDSWMDTINFEGMILPPSTQIIEAEPSRETTEYFVPRQPAPRPLEVINPTLPPPRIKAYDDDSDDFLAPPLKLQKVQDPNKDDTKHCKTCACNLLP